MRFSAEVSSTRLTPRAVAIADQLDHPVYDCLYLPSRAEQTKPVTAELQLLPGPSRLFTLTRPPRRFTGAREPQLHSDPRLT